MKTISFKVSEDEASSIRSRAKQDHLTVSEFLRRQVLGQGRESSVGRVRCEFTGAEIFSPSAESEPLTTEAVRKMLGDFP
jgi:hypothetical protein